MNVDLTLWVALWLGVGLVIVVIGLAAYDALTGRVQDVGSDDELETWIGSLGETPAKHAITQETGVGWPVRMRGRRAR